MHRTKSHPASFMIIRYLSIQYNCVHTEKNQSLLLFHCDFIKHHYLLITSQDPCTEFLPGLREPCSQSLLCSAGQRRAQSLGFLWAAGITPYQRWSLSCAHTPPGTPPGTSCGLQGHTDKRGATVSPPYSDHCTGKNWVALFFYELVS